MAVSADRGQERRQFVHALDSAATRSMPSATVMAKVHEITERYPTARWPKPRTKFDIVPDSSTPVIIAKVPATDPILYRVDLPADRRPASTLGLKPPFPEGVQLAYLVYWQQVFAGSFSGPSTVPISRTSKKGITQTDSNTLTEEIGVGVSYSYLSLSAKLTETFSHSITITEEDTFEWAYTFTIPANKFATCIVWQLVEVFEFLDSADKPLAYSGWAPAGPSDPSGAWYNFKLPSGFVNRAQTVVGDQTDFDATTH